MTKYSEEISEMYVRIGIAHGYVLCLENAECVGGGGSDKSWKVRVVSESDLSIW